MDESPHPRNRWWPLTFEHEGSLVFNEETGQESYFPGSISRVQETGQQSYLAGSGAWTKDLGLGSYKDEYTGPAGGLAGNLAIVLGLVAFSCKSRRLHDVLIQDRALRSGARWEGHNHSDGRKIASPFLTLIEAS